MSGIDDAFSRILYTETGLNLQRSSARFLGVYEHLYSVNRFCEPGYGTHYVVLGYDVTLQNRPDIQLDDQHSAIKWLPIPDLLAAPDVHENTKAYFR